MPVSAKNGDNVTDPLRQHALVRGRTLLERLEAAAPETFDAAGSRFRMPVQWVNRPNLDFRGFAGTIVCGIVRPGDAVAVPARPAQRASRRSGAPTASAIAPRPARP